MQNLPRLEDVERLSSMVIRILGGNPGKFTLQGTNTYLLGTGPTRLLIDTGQGFPVWRAHLADLLRAERCTISHALLTHWHHDHVGGVRDLRDLCPGVRICKHYPPDLGGRGEGGLGDGEENGRDEEKAEKYADISDGEVFAVQGARVRAVFCPGHTEDHMAFLLLGEGDDDDDDERKGGKKEEEEDRREKVIAMFTGDNVLGHGTAVFESLPVYLASLARMAEWIRPASAGNDEGSKSERVTGYPGHGDVLPDCHAKIQEYLLHRRRREGEVLRALEAGDDTKDDEKEGEGGGGGGKTAMEIVEVVYKDYPKELWEPARGGVMQILRKLQEEGKVKDSGGEKWTMLHHASKSSEEKPLL